MQNAPDQHKAERGRTANNSKVGGDRLSHR
jgi:hypothetical protein